MPSQIHQDDVGTRFLMTVKDGSDLVNISGAVSLRVDIRKPSDTMANLRAKQNHGQKWTGIDARNMKIADMMAINVVEPIVVKEQIIKSATEAACMILRIDDVIAISGAPGGGGSMPGMG